MQYYNDYNDRYKNGPDNYQHYSGDGGSGFFEGIKSFCKNYLVTPEKHFNGSPSRISLVCLLQVLFVRLCFLMTGMEISNFGKQ